MEEKTHPRKLIFKCSKVSLKVPPYNQTTVHWNNSKCYSREKPLKVIQLNKTFLFLVCESVPIFFGGLPCDQRPFQIEV